MHRSSEAQRNCENTQLLLQGEAKNAQSGLYGSVSENICDETEKIESVNIAKGPTPLPLKQLLVVFVMRLAEPIAYAQVFPMMEDVGAVDDPRKAGYYSGVLESAFAIAELLTIMKWGSLSDQIGRKPVLLLGFIGAMLSTLMFGFSKSFLWALTTRCLAGGLSGNIAVLLSAVGDMTDETNHARAFALFGVANNVAQMAGPFIGGKFADPYVTFPNSLGNIKLFQNFPYLLPCLISALVTLIAVFFCVALFEETNRREHLRDTSDVASEPQPDSETAWTIARDPIMSSVLMPFFLLSILNTSMLVVFSLFAYTPIPYGGLSRNPEEIGFAIASAGLSGAIIQIIVLPELQHHFGTLSLYRFFMSLWPVIYLLFPVLNAIAKYTAGQFDGRDSVQYSGSMCVWIGIIVLLSLNRLAAMAFSLNLILTKNASPSSSMLGKVFGLSHFTNCFARAIAPSFSSSLFAFSKEGNILGGDFVWVVMCSIALLGRWVTYKARDGSLERDGQ
ncbi:hypothetical protein ACEPAG_6441 [Sanghuangporus baumii]